MTYIKKFSSVDDYEQPESLAIQSSDEPARDLLFDEHRSLLRAVGPARLVNRVILCVLVLLQIFYSPPSLRWSIVVIAAGTLVSAFWYLHELMTYRNVDQIEKLIAETYTRRITSVDKIQPVITRPPKEPITETKVTPEQTAEVWIKAYINRRHERWISANLERVQRSEPMAWLTLLLVLELGRLLIR